MLQTEHHKPKSLSAKFQIQSTQKLQCSRGHGTSIISCTAESKLQSQALGDIRSLAQNPQPQSLNSELCKTLNPKPLNPKPRVFRVLGLKVLFIGSTIVGSYATAVWDESASALNGPAQALHLTQP